MTPHDAGVRAGQKRGRTWHGDKVHVTETAEPDGSATKRTTISERIDLVIRTVDRTGRMRTFADTDAPEE